MFQKGAVLLFRGFGIPVRVHWTFSLLLLYVIGIGLQRGTASMEIAVLCLYVMAVFLCVLLHEFGHALMAKVYKIDTVDITLLPIGGMARLKSIPRIPLHELLVAVAGPAVNLGICLVVGLFLILFTGYNPFFLDSLFSSRVNNLQSATNFSIALWQTNLFLAIFNMVPAFPMDGGRVLRAGLQLGVSRLLATQIATFVSLLLAALTLYYAYENQEYLLGLIAVFIGFQSLNERNAVQIDSLLAPHKVSTIYQSILPLISLHHNVGHAFDLLVRESGDNVLVFEALDIQKPVGVLSMFALKSILKEDKTNAHLSIENIPLDAFSEIDTSYSIIAAAELMQDENTGLCVVRNAEGRVVGMLSRFGINAYGDLLKQMAQ